MTNAEAEASIEAEDYTIVPDAEPSVSEFTARAAEAAASRLDAFRGAVTAFAMLVVLAILQAVFNIDGMLTALQWALAGAITTYFGLGAIGKARVDKEQRDA